MLFDAVPLSQSASLLSAFGDEENLSSPPSSSLLSPISISPESDGEKDIFTEKKRKAWHEDNADLARCDFQPGKAALSLRGDFRAITLWRRSVKGATLSEIKESEQMIPFFIEHLSFLISSVIGSSLLREHFAIVAPPKRRHKERNFASMVAQGIAERLGINFHEDFATCKSRERINPEFFAEFMPPEHNIIVVNDFITTGSTLIAMYNLLTSIGKNPIIFAGVLNKK
ncbi:MAG: phosphoribosyltransferase [Muribaculaceae bacterium]|nr:phosphoribosyltransferase [Muribaculaceae bacterium]